MRMRTALLLSCILLLLAAAPWLLSSCARQPLLPDELRQARAQYEARVETAQAATMEAQRRGESIRKVVSLGTVAATEVRVTTTSAPMTATPIPTSTVSVTPTMMPPPVETTGTPILDASSVVIVRTTVLTPTIAANQATTGTDAIAATSTISLVTTTRVVVRSNATPAAPTSGPVNGDNVPTLASRPMGLLPSVDVITEEMLTTQIQQDARDLTLAGLTVRLAPDGFHAFGELAIGFGFSQPVEVHGTLAVANDNLVAQVSSILLNGLDITERYGSELEGRINWGLYQLLPERYVDSFELSAGQVTIQSQVKS